MKLLMLAFVEGDERSVLRKLHQQLVAVQRRLPAAVGVVIGSNPRGRSMDGFRFQFVDADRAGAPRRIDRFHLAYEITRQLRPTLVYFRCPLYDSHALRFADHLRNVVFEVQTIAEHEVAADKAALDVRYGPETIAVARGIVGVTQQILDYELGRAATRVPGYVMPNGCDAGDIAPLPPAAPDPSGQVRVGAAASFAPWHGIERLLHGMATPAGRRIVLDLAGHGVELPKYVALAQSLGLADRVRVHGHLEPPALRQLAGRWHVGLGTLRAHVLQLTEVAALKHREYCLQGMPFLFAGADPDFPARLPFVEIVPATDDPIPADAVLRLADRAARVPRLHEAERVYGEAQVTWEAKADGLVDFLRKVA